MNSDSINNVAGSFTRQYPANDPSKLIVYPISGSLQHLPARTTVTGDPALPNPTHYTNFLSDLPAHCYELPKGVLNFTIVEILVLLPNWFKNKALCARFLNNNLTGHIHFMILEEHRELQLGSEYERERARKWITDEYRKAMRKIVPDWIKAKHVVAADWVSTAIGMDGFCPDDVDSRGYRRVPSILFKDLAIGVKKMPEGPAAGDLTRALLFALENKQDYSFPEDLPTILDYIGRTHITKAHTDRPLVRVYAERKRQEDIRKRQEDISHRTFRQQSNNANRAAQTQPISEGYAPANQQGIAAHDGTMFQMRDPFTLQHMAQQTLDYGAQNLWQDTPQGVEAVPGNRVLSHPVEDVQGDRSGDDMFHLLHQHLTPKFDMVVIPPTGLQYAPDFQLRDCIEGNIAFDGSPLARAAKFAQREDQMGVLWCVEHVPLLNQLLDAARAEIQN
ncbi:hypothetical protein G6514_003021 [Epicoccum nigrum]|nr:hypothetical protein G6514_003021 [Epicoccum nigrum]